MKSYTQLTPEERYHIYLELKNDLSLRAIAQGMGRHVSTLSRELQRNSGKRGYRHKQAQRHANARHHNKPKEVKMTKAIRQQVESGLSKNWSPEQISGRLRVDNLPTVSHETIYRYILADKRSGGELYRCLRHQMKHYRKRYGKTDRRGRIPDRVDIADRPGIVNNRLRIGDWEGDLVVGKHHQGMLVTLSERKSRLTLIGHVVSKHSPLVADEVNRLLASVTSATHTITFDNGKEFSAHQQISKQLACDIYFATPYHSWERGLNENTNGLIRQYFPKKMSLRQVTKAEAQHVAWQLNNRPRKCLEFKTPLEVFQQETKLKNIFNNVALMG